MNRNPPAKVTSFPGWQGCSADTTSGGCPPCGSFPTILMSMHGVHQRALFALYICLGSLGTSISSTGFFLGWTMAFSSVAAVACSSNSTCLFINQG